MKYIFYSVCVVLTWFIVTGVHYVANYETPEPLCMLEDMSIVLCNKGEARQLSEIMCVHPDFL